MATSRPTSGSASASSRQKSNASASTSSPISRAAISARRPVPPSGRQGLRVGDGGAHDADQSAGPLPDTDTEAAPAGVRLRIRSETFDDGEALFDAVSRMSPGVSSPSVQQLLPVTESVAGRRRRTEPICDMRSGTTAPTGSARPTVRLDPRRRSPFGFSLISQTSTQRFELIALPLVSRFVLSIVSRRSRQRFELIPMPLVKRQPPKLVDG